MSDKQPEWYVNWTLIGLGAVGFIVVVFVVGTILFGAATNQDGKLPVVSDKAR